MWKKHWFTGEPRERIEDGIWWQRPKQRHLERCRDSGVCISCGKPSGGTLRCSACNRKYNARRDQRNRARLIGSGVSEALIQRKLIGGKRVHRYDDRPRHPLPIKCDRCGTVREVTRSTQKKCPHCERHGFPIPSLAVRELVRLSEAERLDRLVGQSD